VFTGCAHPGIIKIVEKAKELVDAKIHLVVGGFHLGGTGEEEIKRIATSLHMLGVERVMPCHCTGSLATKIFAESYGQGFVGCGVGKTVEVG
ncbi:MAG: MBL fold metallo-hydrolase, partial [Methanobacteriota archaeon]